MRLEFRRDLAFSHNNLGMLLQGTGRLNEAESAFTHGFAILKQLARDFPSRIAMQWPELAEECMRQEKEKLL
jgi:hypothetical protein